MELKNKFRNKEECHAYILALYKKQTRNNRHIVGFIAENAISSLKLEDVIYLYLYTFDKANFYFNENARLKIQREKINDRKLYNRLLKSLPNEKITVQHRIINLLGWMLPYLPFSYSQRLFDYLIASGNDNHIHSAYFIINKVWNKSAAEAIYATIKKRHDAYSLIYIIRKEPLFVLERLQEIWNRTDVFSPYLKHEIIDKLAPNHFEYFTFLKKADSLNYLRVCKMAGKPLDEKLLSKHFHEIEHSERIAYLKDAFKKGNFKFIKKHMPELETFLS